MSNIFDKLSKAYESFKGKDTQVNMPTGYETYTYGVESQASKTSDYLQEMKSWVGSCVCAISDEMASIDLKLYKKTKDGVEEVKEHEILELLYKVNSFTTQFDHFWLTQAFLELTGESPWFLERTGKVITNIYFLRPDKITPIPDKTKVIKGYRYQVSSRETITLEPQDVLFLKYPDPSKPLRGIGTLKMAARTVDIDNSAEEWNFNFYNNSARPDSVLTVKAKQLNEEQKKKLKKSIEKNYQGTKNAHQMMILFGEMELSKLGMSQKDMDFYESSKFNRDKILGLFRVPKAILAQTDDVNYANAKTAQYIFARYTIKPKMERMVQQLNEFLLPMFPNTEQMFLDFSNPVPEDVELKLKEYESGLKNGYMTINEVREAKGLEPVEGGDVIYLPANLWPIGVESSNPDISKIITLGYKQPREIKQKFVGRLREVRARDKDFYKAKEAEDELKEKIKNAISAEYKSINEKNDRIQKGQELPDEKKAYYWKVKNLLVRKHIPIIKRKMEDLFIDQARRTLIKMNGNKAVTKASANSIYEEIKLHVSEEIKINAEFTLEPLADLYKASGDKTFELMDVDQEIDLEDEGIKKWLGDENRLFAKSVTETTNQKIKAQLLAGFKAGETMPEIKKRIKEVFLNASDSRAELIARTECLKHNVSATEQAFIDSNIVEKKQWRTNPTACEYCRPLEGKVLKLGGDYFKLGDTVSGDDGGSLDLTYDIVKGPPLHCNCECDLLPIYKKG